MHQKLFYYVFCVFVQTNPQKIVRGDLSLAVILSCLTDLTLEAW